MPELNTAELIFHGKRQGALLDTWRTAYHAMLRVLAEGGTPICQVVEQVRRDYVAQAMLLTGGNRCKAAARIGIHRNTMARYIRRGGEE